MCLAFALRCGDTVEAPLDPTPPVQATIRFTDVSSKLGVPPARYYGASLVDYDDDGWPDLTLAHEGGLILKRGGPGGVFEDDNARSGVPSDLPMSHGVTWADLEGDGDLDLLVTRTDSLFTSTLKGIAHPKLYINQGGAVFKDGTEAAGLVVLGAFEGAAFGDLDGDDDLDLLLTDGAVSALDDTDPRLGYGNRALLNDGTGYFTDITDTFSCTGEVEMDAWIAVIADLDGDADPDIYVGNDKAQSTFCTSDGKGHFSDISSQFSEIDALAGIMGVALGDFDSDGCIDLFGTNFGRSVLMTPNNTGAITNRYLEYIDDGFDPNAGVSGWGTVALDAELDGDLDLAWIAAYNDYIDNAGAFVPGRIAFLETTGQGDATRLKDVTAAVIDPALDIDHNGYGMARGDIDRDGDVDLLIAVDSVLDPAIKLLPDDLIWLTPLLLQNDSRRVDGEQAGHSLTVLALQSGKNPRAVGATVLVEVGGRRVAQAVAAGESYASSNTYDLVFGLGEAHAADSVTVRWPDGAIDVFPNVPAGFATLVRKAPPGRAARSAWPSCGPPPPGLDHSEKAACEAACGHVEACGWLPLIEAEAVSECFTDCSQQLMSKATLACVTILPCADDPKVCGVGPDGSGGED